MLDHVKSFFVIDERCINIFTLVVKFSGEIYLRQNDVMGIAKAQLAFIKIPFASTFYSFMCYVKKSLIRLIHLHSLHHFVGCFFGNIYSKSLPPFHMYFRSSVEKLKAPRSSWTICNSSIGMLFESVAFSISADFMGGF